MNKGLIFEWRKPMKLNSFYHVFQTFIITFEVDREHVKYVITNDIRPHPRNNNSTFLSV